jgi:hypothetical protein
VQTYEKAHLELRVQINNLLIKVAQTLFELHKKRVLSTRCDHGAHSHSVGGAGEESGCLRAGASEGLHEESQEDWQEEVDKIIRPMGEQADKWRREEGTVLEDINEEVEAIRRLKYSEDDDDEY